MARVGRCQPGSAGLVLRLLIDPRRSIAQEWWLGNIAPKSGVDQNSSLRHLAFVALGDFDSLNHKLPFKVIR